MPVRVGLGHGKYLLSNWVTQLVEEVEVSKSLRVDFNLLIACPFLVEGDREAVEAVLEIVERNEDDSIVGTGMVGLLSISWGPL